MDVFWVLTRFSSAKHIERKSIIFIAMSAPIVRQISLDASINVFNTVIKTIAYYKISTIAHFLSFQHLKKLDKIKS